MPMGGGRGIHDGGFRLHPGSDHVAAHGTGGNADTRMAAYPFDLPGIREGVDIQDAMLFSKPYRGLDGCPIPFDTLQIEILLTRKESEVGARHRHAFMLDPMGMSRGPIISGIQRPSVLHTGEPRYVTTIREPSTRL
jgi:hypothetical protein